MNEIDNINTVPDAILKLIQEFSKLPGIGKKTAQRLTYHLVRTNLEDALSLSESIMTVKNNIILCSECSNITQIDPKTKLQEYSLKKYKKLPIYKMFKKTGPNHNPFFKVQVQISNSKKYFGYGKSKKLAQKSAASKLIKNLNLN